MSAQQKSREVYSSVLVLSQKYLKYSIKIVILGGREPQPIGSAKNQGIG